MNKFLSHLMAWRASIDARRASLDAEDAILREQIQLVENPHFSIDLPTHFNPDWKLGKRLTTLGRRALESCFKQGMRQSEVSRLFRISLTRAHVLHNEWKERQATSAAAENRRHV